jgi:hypothetical protein
MKSHYRYSWAYQRWCLYIKTVGLWLVLENKDLPPYKKRVKP